MQAIPVPVSFNIGLIVGGSMLAGLIIIGSTMAYQSHGSLRITSRNASADTIKSVRVDLSSFSQSDNQGELRQDIINRLATAGANTVFISPWSDGFANYQSSSAPLNDFGQQSFLEDFIDQAHRADLKVYAWFVVGKDNFPAASHPEWYAQTINGQPYRHEDEPGLFLPVASLANQDYLDYHLALLREVNQLPIDGWVISEPLASWGDRYDSDYADFSAAAREKFQQESSLDADTVLDDPEAYTQWIKFRAQTVTDFVAASMAAIKENSAKPIVITIFTEPDKRGRLISFAQIKEWLGTDIAALAKLGPDYVEIQSLFADFEYPQDPSWTRSMINQFRRQWRREFRRQRDIKKIPLLVSVQGFGGNAELTADDFGTGISSASFRRVSGVSFYAYHTLSPEHWEALAKAWQ